MSYRKMLVIAVISLVAITSHDAWVIWSGHLDLDSYVPGLYPLTCICWVVGTCICKRRGLWVS